MDIKPSKFTLEGRKLEIRAFLGTNTVKVSAFEGDRQVSPNLYNASYEDIAAARMLNYPVDMVRIVMETVQIEIEKGIVKLR